MPTATRQAALRALLSAMLVLVASTAVARDKTPRGAGLDGSLVFESRDGWSGGALRYSPASEVLVLKFKRGAKDPVGSLAPHLGPVERRVFSRVEAVPNEGGSMTVRVHVERRGYKARLRTDRRRGGIVLEVELPAVEELGVVSYAELLPARAERAILAEVEADMADGKASCRPLAALRRTAEPWGAWAALRLADCLRLSGERGGSVGLALDLAGNPDVPQAVSALASLRLEEWALNLQSAMEPRISPDVVANLPLPVAQELGLRLARTLAIRGRTPAAAAALQAVSRLGDFPIELEPAFQTLRLMLMHQLAEEEAWLDASRLYLRYPLPALGSAARESTIRLGALSLARTGLVDRAVGAAALILRTGGRVVDPELEGALYEALVAADQPERAHELLGGEPALAVWAGVRSTDTGVLTTTEGRAVATGIVRVWRTEGVGAAARVAQAESATDPEMVVAELRMAAMLGAGDCPALDSAPDASMPPSRHAWAATCWLGRGDVQAAAAAAVKGDIDPMAEDDDSFETLVRAHVEGAADFQARMDELMGKDQAPETTKATTQKAETTDPGSKKRKKGKRGRSR